MIRETLKSAMLKRFILFLQKALDKLLVKLHLSVCVCVGGGSRVLHRTVRTLGRIPETLATDQ